MALREFSLEGKVAIVTGAGRGIGRAIALTFAEAGADIVAAARTEEQIQSTSEEALKLGRKSLAIPTDVTRADQVEAMVEKTISEFGRIDILVNNAGTTLRKAVVPLPGVRLADWQRVNDFDNPMSEAEWRHMMDTNLTSAFLCCRAVGPHMIAQKRGKVINISSIHSQRGATYNAAYHVGKAGMEMLTRCLALEWGPFHINVNAIGPGYFHTAASAKRHQDPELREEMLRRVPLGRVGEVREIALLAVYLASEASDFLTGQTIYLDGGYLAR